MEAPFRWNVGRREQLGALGDPRVPDPYEGFSDELRQVAARVVALCRGADLVFVGRSPESLFDYLGGVLAQTSWARRLSMLNVSVRGQTLADLRARYPTRLPALRAHLAALSLDPESLARRPRPVAFVDFVSSGSTFAHIAEIVCAFAEESSPDPPAVRRKVRFLGITRRAKSSPNAFRWQSDADWLGAFEPGAVKNVSAPGSFWSYLADYQPKVASTNPVPFWGDEIMPRPPREAGSLAALRLARRLFEQGSSVEERRRFAAELCRQPGMREGWLRALVIELRRAPAGAPTAGRHPR